MDRCAVRRVPGAEHVAGVQPSRSLCGRHPAVILLAEAPRAVVLQQFVDPPDLRFVAGQIEISALGEVAVDAFAGGDAGHLVDRVVHRALQGDGTVAAVPLCHLLEAHRQQRPTTSRRFDHWPRTRRTRPRRPPRPGSGRSDAGSRPSTNPVYPAPTMTTSAAISPGNCWRVAMLWSAGSESSQKDTARGSVIGPDTTQCVGGGPTLAPMLPTPTGWFPDPWNESGVRYWDGRGWTGHAAMPVPRPQPHPSLPIRAAWGAVITLMVSLIAGRYLLKAIAGYEWPIAVYVLILGVVSYAPSLTWCWYASRRWGSGRFRSDVGFSARWVDAGWGPVTWASVSGDPDRRRG